MAEVNPIDGDEIVRMVSYETVKSVEERKTKVWLRGVGSEARFTEQSEGWWVYFPSLIGMFVGYERPDLKAGDRIRITLEKVS